MGKVLLTGGSGFIAAHILSQLLESGRSVVTTVRSEDKASKIREAYKNEADRLQVVIVPDIAKEDAFDEVVKIPDLEAVLHTASPFHFNFTDPQKELIDPALIGTTAILKAVKRSAPSVKRVVVTSSFAAILDADRTEDPNTLFTDASWNPVTLANIHDNKASAYRASKTLAEHAAWDFVAAEKPNFDLATVNPPLVLGPVVHHLATLDTINTSNERVVNLLRGEWRDQVPPNGGTELWIDVRDCARAHVAALDKPAAGGHRLFTVGGRYSHNAIVDAVRSHYPEYEDKLPPPNAKGGEYLPADKTFKYNTDETDKILGIKWTSLDKSISDLVGTLKAHGV